MNHCQPSVSPSSTQFGNPIKRIFDSQGSAHFQSSVALYRLSFFINKYVKLVKGATIPNQSTYSSTLPIVNGVVTILDRFSQLVDETPPRPGPRRFGNLACRTWHDKINAIIFDLVKDLVILSLRTDTDTDTDTDSQLLQENNENIHLMLVELVYYLQNCFGSRTRLDFGTGHELSFIAFIAALDMLNLYSPNLTADDILYIFQHYYNLIKKLIVSYTLEPAGSHGVWGLDDHFHFIYLLGSSQWLVNDDDRGDKTTKQAVSKRAANVRPMDMLNRSIINTYKAENFYCQAIDFIFTVKSGPFNEHSPILFDIAKSVKSWTKVLQGLLRMYSVEVLNKFPVVQHFWFGSGFYPWTDVNTGKLLPLYEHAIDDGTVAGDTDSKQGPSDVEPDFSSVSIASSSVHTSVPQATTVRSMMPTMATFDREPLPDYHRQHYNLNNKNNGNSRIPTDYTHLPSHSTRTSRIINNATLRPSRLSKDNALLAPTVVTTSTTNETIRQHSEHAPGNSQHRPPMGPPLSTSVTNFRLSEVRRSETGHSETDNTPETVKHDKNSGGP